MIGIERLLHDLREQGYEQVHALTDGQGQAYAVLPNFEIPAGTFAGRVIDLAIPAPADYPRALHSSIHLRATPHLVPFGGNGSRNVINSNLGADWQYWSYQFFNRPANPTAELMTQINAVFRKN